MNNVKAALLILIFIGIGHGLSKAQTTSASDFLVAQPIADRTVGFDLSEPGVAKPIIWGLDLAWLSEDNIRRGIEFMGGTNGVDIIRSSFMPTQPLNNGSLQGDALTNTNIRINIINKYFDNMNVGLNCDHPSVHSWYSGNAANWAALIDETARMHQDAGLNVVTVSPFNEPDYGWGQGSIQDFYNIIGELGNNSRFDTIRISGGNTLNCDEALNWYEYLNPAGLEEGNTHQLAGVFDTYAGFFEAVRANGDHATADELHNVMEAMVGVEYGMQTGIWWGTAEYARGEFCKASDGVRLGYAEHRPNWTAASVYKHPEGHVQGFVGSSERQAATTTYRFFSKERDVFYDGHGPQREFVVEMPGGTGYQQGQTNAERVVNITWGDDIQPVIDGQYVIVNRNSGLVMEVENGSTNAGANIRQGAPLNTTYQRWNVTPVDNRIGGDFSYFTFIAAHSGKSPDVNNWSLDNGGNIMVWDDTKGGNQQWYLEYAEDGWFYIRSRHSSKCLHVANASTANRANIIQWEKNGSTAQQWRFLPVGTDVEFEAPRMPGGLKATANAESILLDWNAGSDDDIEGYTVFRAESSSGEYQTIARNVTTTSYIDNTVTSGKTYYYAIKAVDQSLNSSDYSLQVSATATGENTLMALLRFEGNMKDSSVNLNHGATYGEISYTEGKLGANAIELDGVNDFIQLPATIANHNELTIASWVYWKKVSLWQRIFDFGNGEDEYMFLTPVSNTGKLRLAIKNNGVEHQLDAPALSFGKWMHVAVTLGENGAKLYVNGELAAESEAVTIRPGDFKPALNYIGRSQFSGDPLFSGNIDEFRIYNYELTPENVAGLASMETGFDDQDEAIDILDIWPTPAIDILRIRFNSEESKDGSVVSIYNTNGKMVLNKSLSNSSETELNVSALPTGVYILKLATERGIRMEKIVIKR